MKSTVVTTSEVDDLELAASTLAAQVREKLDLAGNSVGIAYCDADVDVAGLGGLLHAELGIDVVGLTTTATMERNGGYSDMGIVLCVLTADDAHFVVGCTEDLERGSFREAVATSYARARALLRNDPGLIMTLAPYIADITSENYVDILDKASGGVPVFGGVATDHYDLKFQKTFFNDRAFTRGLVFLLIEGNVKPVFAMEHHFGAKAEKKGIITQSKDNLVQKVGDRTFKDFVASIVPVPDEELVIFHFQSTPFVMELPDFEKGEQPVVRALCTIDHATGAGGFLSRMPEGSTIHMNVLQRDNLSESCRGALANITMQMEKNADYAYSMLFVCSCNARHLLMGDRKNLEGDVLRENLRALPQELNAMGFYAFGEMCPTGKKAGGAAKNRFHNISFAVCAI